MHFFQNLSYVLMNQMKIIIKIMESDLDRKRKSMKLVNFTKLTLSWESLLIKIYNFWTLFFSRNLA